MYRKTFVCLCRQTISRIYTIFNTVHAISDINNIYQFQDLWRIFTRVRVRTPFFGCLKLLPPGRRVKRTFIFIKIYKCAKHNFNYLKSWRRRKKFKKSLKKTIRNAKFHWLIYYSKRVFFSHKNLTLSTSVKPQIFWIILVENISNNLGF